GIVSDRSFAAFKTPVVDASGSPRLSHVPVAGGRRRSRRKNHSSHCDHVPPRVCCCPPLPPFDRRICPIAPSVHFYGGSTMRLTFRPVSGSSRRPAPRLRFEPLEDRSVPSAAFWSGFGGNAQHTAISSVASQSLDTIQWQSAVDLNPQYSGNDLLIH